MLVVSSTPGLTAKWLVPRLYKFLALHPEIETRITASVAYANFATDDIDVGIRLSSGVHPDLYVEKLSDEWLLPLCSPRLLEGRVPLTSAQDLKRFTLIQVDLPGVVPTWTDWMEMAGLDGIDSTRGLRLNVADHALDAASEGVGVVLAYKMVAARDIALKRLVVPFGRQSRCRAGPTISSAPRVRRSARPSRLFATGYSARCRRRMQPCGRCRLVQEVRFSGIDAR